MKLSSDLRIRAAGIMGLTEFSCLIEPGKATEVTGPNAAGKSSLATALMAVAAREINPRGIAVSGIRKAYVNDGSDPGDAYATIDVAGFKDTWRPATGEVEAVGEHPVSSSEAVGLVDFTSRRSAKERAAILQGILLPPADQVEAKVAEVLTRLLGEQDARGAILMVQDRGWEAAVAVYQGARQAGEARVELGHPSHLRVEGGR